MPARVAVIGLASDFGCQVQITNSGGAAVQVVIRVFRSTGTAGAYKLSLAY